MLHEWRKLPPVSPPRCRTRRKFRPNTTLEGSARTPFSFSPIVSVIVEAGAIVEGFTIRSVRPNDNRVGVQLAGIRATARNNTIRDFEQYRGAPGFYWIVSNSGRVFRIEGNLTTNSLFGINLIVGGDGIRLEGNTLTHTVGGMLPQSNPGTYDQGGGPLGSPRDAR
ncbi:MAG: hypothetical protein ACI8TX_003869 [Hyphomicrobiaceae bacterium]